jgi:lysylphosphatidylglycerol synthetase-like protein (DUF2156 family)
LLGFRASRRSHGLELVDSLSAADVQVRISSTRYGCLHRVPVVSFLTNGAILLALLLAAMGSLSLSLSLCVCMCLCVCACACVHAAFYIYIYIYMYVCIYKMLYGRSHGHERWNATTSQRTHIHTRARLHTRLLLVCCCCLSVSRNR